MHCLASTVQPTNWKKNNKDEYIEYSRWSKSTINTTMETPLALGFQTGQTQCETVCLNQPGKFAFPVTSES